MLLLGAKSLGPYVIWIAVMIGGLVLATIVLLIVRARVLAKETGSMPAGMLEDLRRMRDRGEITPEEFDAAKAAMVSKMAPGRAGTAPVAGPAPGPRETTTPQSRVARPGYDLTGRPLPPRRDEGPAR